MSIQVFRDFPVINGYVQVPSVREGDRTRVTLDEALDAISGSTEVVLSQGSGRVTGSKFGAQRFLRLPAIDSDSWYASDPVDDLS